MDCYSRICYNISTRVPLVYWFNLQLILEVFSVSIQIDQSKIQIITDKIQIITDGLKCYVIEYYDTKYQKTRIISS